MTSRLFFASLRLRLLLMVLLAVVPPVGLMLYIATEWRSHAIEEAQAHVMQLARHASAIHEGATKTARDALLGLAQTPAVVGRDRARCEEIVGAFFRVNREYQNLGVALPNGDVACSARPSASTVNIAARPHFRRAIETRALAIGDYETDARAGTTTATLAYPLLDARGEVKKVLFAVVRLDWPRAFSAEALQANGTTITVFDETGMVVAHGPGTTRTWVGRRAARRQRIVLGEKSEGAGRGGCLDDVPCVFALRRVSGPPQAEPLYVSVAIPTAVVLAQPDYLLARNLAGLGLVVLLAMGAARLGADLFVLRRVKAMVKAVQRLRVGDLSARTGLPPGPGELNQLAGAFDEMAAALDARQKELLRAHEELEARVQERTADLRKANEALQTELAERRRAEDSVRKLSQAIEQTVDSVFITNREGVIEYANAAFETMTGYTRAEATGQTRKIVRSGTIDDHVHVKLHETIRSGQVFRGVFLNKKKCGELYHEEETITPVKDSNGEITHFVAAGRDITRRIRTEAALRRLNDSFEREAERIAQALHDEAGQFLTSAHITLADVGRDLPAPARERLQEVRQHLDQVEAQLRRLSHELRPRILDDLGLVPAIQFLAEGVGKRAGTAIGVDASLEGRLPPVVETALYRFAQESLTNMTKHAKAQKMTIHLERKPQQIHCIIRDDGVGFDAPTMLSRPGKCSLGMLGIRDRIEALGGTLQVTSAPGRGTELFVTIPLET